jgi:DNA gyrase subunit A
VTAADQHLTGTQADAILSMQLQRLTGLEIGKLVEEYRKLTEEIEGYEAILRDEALVLDIIREDLYEIKDKFGDKRRTEIGAEVGEFQIEELVPDEQMIVTITRDGYIKRVPYDAYRKQGRGGRGVRSSDTKEGDFLEHLFAASTHDYLLVFTNRGRVYWLKVYDIPNLQRTARGRALANLLQMQPNETHQAILPVREFEEKFVFFATAKGIVKKTPLSAFRRPMSKGIIAISLDLDDTLIGAAESSGSDEIVLGTRNGWALRFDEQDVRAMGRSARGVRGISLRGDDAVVDMIVTNDSASVLTVCEKGYGKRTQVGEYRKTRRGGKGVINIKATERNGRVVALKSVTDTDELMIISAKGIALRTDLKQLREIGRATQGVRVIRLDEDDLVVAVARIAKEEDEEAALRSAEGAGSNGEAVSPDAEQIGTTQKVSPDQFAAGGPECAEVEPADEDLDAEASDEVEDEPSDEVEEDDELDEDESEEE